MSQLDEFKNGRTKASGSDTIEESEIIVIEYKKEIQSIQSTSYAETVKIHGITTDFRSLRDRMRDVKIHGDELFLDETTE